MVIFALLQLFFAYLVPATPLTFSKGQVEEGVYIKHTFILKNPSEDTVYILALRRGCGCTEAKILDNKTVIPPNDSLKVYVKVSTRGYRGEIKKQVILYYREGNSKDQQFVRLIVKAKVIKYFESPSAVWYSTHNVIFDVRSKKDFEKCHIAGSEHINPRTLLTLFKEGKLKIPEHISVYIIGDKDQRALKIVKELKQAGFERAYVVKGGLSGWRKELNSSLLICK